ncbi:MAG: enoyl-CoA hydratase/isomerase family protein [Smithella sp.]|nr:enoyl-CoA hydratase/isomerase family protein [Smithella sp.]HQI74047.1 enoyl-CoA hydratase/isomerase family protein [Smithella sp.]
MKDYGISLKRQEHIAIITLDRPAKHNALDEHMWNCMDDVVTKLKQNLPRVIVITGAGEKAFCAGFDVNPENLLLTPILSAAESHDKRPAHELIYRIRTSIDKLVSLPVPIIAAINGLAYGGGAEIAARCDLRVMNPHAVFCFSEVRLGLMPDHGGVVGLSKLVGASRAADLILTARKVNAQEALHLGLTNRISAPGKALDEALTLAVDISENGPRAVRHALAVIRRTGDLTTQEALELETQQAVDLIASGECIHGVAAFLTRQKPEFPEPE